MSLKFSDLTSARRGIIQGIEDECGFDPGDISGNSALLSYFTPLVNQAHDDFMYLGISSSGKWQFDDSNQTDYPIILANIVSGQRDYYFTTDETNNLILDIYRVMVADSSGKFVDLEVVDQQTPDDNNSNTDSFVNGLNASGVPSRCDLTANALFLDPVPNYSRAASLKVFINREGTYFTIADTTKLPGVPGIFHRYYVIKPSLIYARRKTLASVDRLEREVIMMEANIKNYFNSRQKGKSRGMRPNVESNK